MSSLKSGNTKSCGCLVRDATRTGRPVADRTGQKAGMLTVLRLMGAKDGHARWLCRCDCGTEAVFPAWRLKGRASCGCQQTANGGTSAPKGGRSPGEAARKHVLRQYQKNAGARGHVWELTDEDFDRLTSSDCSYCGTPPSNVFSTGGYVDAAFVYNGIDRKDNTLGYTCENALPCCQICNIAKRAMSYDDFMAWIARLTEYHFFHPDVMPSALLRKAAG
jgi:hypothetical protein